MPNSQMDIYHRITLTLADPWFDISVGVGLFVYLLISWYGRRKEEDDPAHLALTWPAFPTLFLGFLIGMDDLNYPNGHYIPGVSGLGDIAINAFYGLLTIPYVILLLFSVFLVPLGVLMGLPAFVRGLHYLFVPHPAEPYVNPVVKSKEALPLDTAGLAAALKANKEMTGPNFAQENMTRKAERLAEELRAKEKRLREETKIAQAALDYERARAARRDAPR
jgi:membrane-associated protease RseP (regulator of RpoE activity)